MKKTKFLVLVLVVSIMLVGAGYAYWDQTLTINNTVTAGNLDVAFVDVAADGFEFEPYYSNSDFVEVTPPVIAEDGQSIAFTIDKLYPGAGASLAFVVENRGTVAAKIDTVTGTILSNSAFANALNYSFNKIEITTFLGIPIWSKTIDVAADNVPDLATGLTNALKNIKLDPGERLILSTVNPFDNETPIYQILMPETISGSQFENSTTSFKLGLKFVQVN